MIGLCALNSDGYTGIWFLYSAVTLITSACTHRLYLDQELISWLALLIVVYSGVSGRVLTLSNWYKSNNAISKFSSYRPAIGSGVIKSWKLTNLIPTSLPTPSTK